MGKINLYRYYLFSFKYPIKYKCKLIHAFYLYLNLLFNLPFYLTFLLYYKLHTFLSYTIKTSINLSISNIPNSTNAN